MLTTADCKFVISEIRNIPYYDKKIERCDERLEELEDELTSSSGPFSPNGGTDVLIGSTVVRVRIGGHGESSAEKITRISEMKDKVEKERTDFITRRRKAGRYYQELMADTEWGEFVQAFFNNEQYGSLSIKYSIGNPYRQMIQIIKSNVRKV